MKYKECPKCGCEEGYYGFTTILVKERKNQQICKKCRWKGEPFTPETKSIESKKIIAADRFEGFNFEVFDRYGQLMFHSKSYHAEDDAFNEMKQALLIREKYEFSTPCTGILWPDVVVVKGKMYKSEDFEKETNKLIEKS